MKNCLIVVLGVSLLWAVGCGGEGKGDKKASANAKEKKAKVEGEKQAVKINGEVELSCGQCKFGMKGDGCTLAVRVDGKSYYVEGSGIDDHGDAHADDGLCNCIRKAKVVGEIVDGKFKADSIKLVDIAKK